MYHKALVLKCSYVDFQGREMTSVCSESMQAKELRNTRPGRKKKNEPTTQTKKKTKKK